MLWREAAVLMHEFFEERGGFSAAEIHVGEVTTHDVQTCGPDDDVNSAMAEMRRGRVHRLPVVGLGGKLVGIVALNDLALAANRLQFEIDYDGVMETLRAVSEHRDAKPAAAEALTFPPIPVAVA